MTGLWYANEAGTHTDSQAYSSYELQTNSCTYCFCVDSVHFTPEIQTLSIRKKKSNKV